MITLTKAPPSGLNFGSHGRPRYTRIRVIARGVIKRADCIIYCSVIDGSGGCGKDVDGRIKVAWSRWRDLSGVIYDKKVPMKLKSKLYKTVVRPAMVYGSECWALRKQEEQRLHTTEMKMLRWSQGKTRKDRIKNETIRGIARVTPIKSVLAQKRLSWYGHVMRREETHITRSTLNMTVMGTRPRGRPKMRWLDRLKSDMRIYIWHQPRDGH